MTDKPPQPKPTRPPQTTPVAPVVEVRSVARFDARQPPSNNLVVLVMWLAWQAAIYVSGGFYTLYTLAVLIHLLPDAAPQTPTFYLGWIGNGVMFFGLFGLLKLSEILSQIRNS